MKFPLFVMITMFIATAFTAQASNVWRLPAPDSDLRAEIHLNQNQQLQYRLIKNDSTMLDWSPLGVAIGRHHPTHVPLTPEDSDMTHGLVFKDMNVLSKSENYQLLTGKKLNNTAQYTEYRLTFDKPNAKFSLTLEVRMFSDTMAFRYHVKGLQHTSGIDQQFHRLQRETTGFNLGKSGTLWAHPYDFNTLYHPSYETRWRSEPLANPFDESLGTGWALPLLIEKAGHWLFIHESGLDHQFYGAHISPEVTDGFYHIEPPLAGEALTLYPNTALNTLPWAMPWRYIEVHSNIRTVAESNRAFDLATPSKISNTQWITPGRSAWSWWSDHTSSTNPKVLKDFIDLAADMNWEYALIDADWHQIPTEQLQALITHSKQLNVGLLFWYNSGGAHNAVQYGPRNILNQRKTRRAEFAKLQKMGIKGIKVDFMQSDKQPIIQLYHDILEDAAEFELLVNFHGSTMPRGWQRTWPNLMTMESIRGYEFLTFGAGSDYPKYSVYQATLTPFTRNVVGSMDITPVAFFNHYGERITTDSFEATLPIIFESGVTHFADKVESFNALPTDIKRYFSDLPVVWQQTKVLSAELGKHLAMARFDGEVWYIVAINATDEPLTLSLPLSSDMRGKASVISSNQQGKFKPISTTTLSQNLTFTLAPNDGLVWRVKH